MDAITLNHIPCALPYERIARKMRVREGTQQEDQLRELVDQARAIARPRAMYTIVTVDEKDETGVVLGGIRMESRVMRVNLDEIHRVFPFIVTCGQELYQWKMKQEDLILSYYADEINQMAMRAAGEHLLDHLKETYQLGRTATMSPGSLQDWPVNAQRPLFQLLGDPFQAIGVELMDSMLMIPNQTVSGIRFATESRFTSCELCPIGDCPHRKAPYDEGLFDEKYR